jgi:hypothetical protein
MAGKYLELPHGRYILYSRELLGSILGPMPAILRLFVVFSTPSGKLSGSTLK